MANSSIVMLFIAAAVAVVAVTAPAVEALTCGMVASNLAPCINYAKGTSRNLPQGCCNGISRLNSLASNTKDRQDACGCLKTAANSIKGLNLGVIAGLPAKCGVNIPYKISPSTDCAKVK